MNVISYNDKELQTLYNKYRMSSYYPNETMKSTPNQPQYTAIGGHNLLVNSSPNIINNSNPLENKENFIQTIKPIPNLAERNRQNLLKEGDKIFDDLELYGLVLTNDLLKLRRLQQMTNKNDFSLEFSSFRKRLYLNIENVAEKMVNAIKGLNLDYESTNNSILSYFKRNLRRNTEINSKLEMPLKDMTEGLNGKLTNINKLFQKRAERFKALKYFLYPPKVESGIVLPKELTIDWDKRMERLKTTFAYKRLNENYAQKLKFSKQKMDLMNKVAVKEERVRNMKYRDLEKRKKEHQLNFLKEQDQREFDMIEEMDKFQKELDEEEKQLREQLEKQKELEEIERRHQLEEIYNKTSSKEEKTKKEKEKEDVEVGGDTDEEEEEEEDEDEVPRKLREKEFDFTDIMTKKYKKSEKKSDISSLPPANLFRENKK
jgi:hypothetical protein